MGVGPTRLEPTVSQVGCVWNLNHHTSHTNPHGIHWCKNSTRLGVSESCFCCRILVPLSLHPLSFFYYHAALGNSNIEACGSYTFTCFRKFDNRGGFSRYGSSFGFASCAAVAVVPALLLVHGNSVLTFQFPLPDRFFRRVPPCTVKTCDVRPVFARVVGELRAADPSNVQGPVKQNAAQGDNLRL